MRIAPIGLLCLAACSSNETRWESAVRHLNGELVALRPTAQAITAITSKNDPASVRAVVGMCASVDLALERVAKTRQTFHELDDPGGPHRYMTDVADHARWLTQDRFDVCKGDDWRCRDWCVTTWRGFAESVDVLREKAAKHGAHLESLTP